MFTFMVAFALQHRLCLMIQTFACFHVRLSWQLTAACSALVR